MTKIEICFVKGRKHYGTRKKCWLPAFSPFPLMFLKGLSIKVVKRQDCVVGCQKSFFYRIVEIQRFFS